MRRGLLCAVVLLALGAAEPALAAGEKGGGGPIAVGRTPGSELLEIRNGHGRAVISRRGSVLVVVGRGRIRVVDRPGGARPRWSCNRKGVRINASTMEFRGRDVRCHVHGNGPWRVIARGSRISASGRVRGTLALKAAKGKPRGLYRVGQGPFKRWPRAPKSYSLVR